MSVSKQALLEAIRDLPDDQEIIFEVGQNEVVDFQVRSIPDVRTRKEHGNGTTSYGSFLVFEFLTAEANPPFRNHES
jgi:hypothetical protein